MTDSDRDPARMPLPYEIEIPSIEGTMKIDGRLDESAWLAATRIEEFHQVEPIEFGKPAETTLVRVFMDRDHLYVAADMSDAEPGQIRASQLRQRSGLFSDDRFWITLDTFADGRNGYHFAGNPNGVGEDALIENNARMLWDWDGIWDVAAIVTDRGWSIEMAIPFKTVAFDPDATTWGINFGRIIERRKEWIQWSSNGRQDFPEAPAWAGRASVPSDLRQGVGVDITSSLSVNVDDPNRGDLEPSVDLFYRPNPTNTLALTLNTDFAATEVDGRQVSLSRFSLFFPEKRNFFLQDAGIFQFTRVESNGQPYFSRRIGISDDGVPLDIDAGVRLTGRQGRWNYGALAVRQESAIAGEHADLIVARAAANVFDESTVGFIATDGDPDSLASAQTLGLDYRYRNRDFLGSGKTITADFFVTQAERNGIDQDNLSWGMDLQWRNDQHRSRLVVQEIERNFDPALGFVNRSDIRFHKAWYRYRIRPENQTVIRHWDHWLWVDLTTDLDGRTLSRSDFYFTGLRNQTGDSITYQYQASREVLDEPFEISSGVTIPAGDYDWNTHWIFFDSNDSRRYGVDGAVASGGFYGGHRDHARVGIDWRPSAHYTLELDLNYNNIDLPGGDFITRLVQFEAEVSFDRKWSWTSFIQYDNVSDTLGANSRLRYQPTVGQEVVLVLNYNAAVDANYSLSQSEVSGTIKASYTFRF